MPYLPTDKILIADGDYDYNLNRSQDYLIELWDDFGGGTLSVQTANGLTIFEATAPIAYIIEPVGPVVFSLSGSTSPNIQINIKAHNVEKR